MRSPVQNYTQKKGNDVQLKLARYGITATISILLRITNIFCTIT